MPDVLPGFVYDRTVARAAWYERAQRAPEPRFARLLDAGEQVT